MTWTWVKERLQRSLLVSGMVLASANLWTGAPALGLLVGSRVAPSSGISMPAVAAVVATIGAVCWLLLRMLNALGAAHDRLTNHVPAIRRHTPWLRSMSGDRRPELGGETPPLTALEYVLITGVVACAGCFEVWFLFFSTSPFGGPSGR